MKRSKRLSGWNRVGIVASVIWFVLGGFWGHNVGHLRGYHAVVQWRIDCILALPVAPPLPLKSGRNPIKQTPALQQEWDEATPLSPRREPGARGNPNPAQKTTYPAVAIGPVTGERVAQSPAPHDVVPGSDVPNADQDCIQRSDQLWPEVGRLAWKYAALFALVPIALGWPTAYGVSALARWIRAGFTDAGNPN